MSLNRSSRINRIPSSLSLSPSRSSRSSNSSRKSSSNKIKKRQSNRKTKRATPSSWTNHVKICADLYGVKPSFAKGDYSMSVLYYDKKNHDENGNIMYPKKLNKIGRPIDSMLTRKPWTGEAIRNPDGVSANVILV
jgi:hypothetical protein